MTVRKRECTVNWKSKHKIALSAEHALEEAINKSYGRLRGGGGEDDDDDKHYDDDDDDDVHVQEKVEFSGPCITQPISKHGVFFLYTVYEKCTQKINFVSTPKLYENRWAGLFLGSFKNTSFSSRSCYGYIISCTFSSSSSSSSSPLSSSFVTFPSQFFP